MKDVEEVETGSTGSRKGDGHGRDIRCRSGALPPLRVARVVHSAGAGASFAEDLHPIQLRPESGRGYTLCDDCGVLANLPTDLTRN